MQNKLAVQLFTLREACKADFPGVLRELARAGWAGVQFAGFHGYDPQELKAVIRETGLKVAGMHYGYADVVNRTEKLAEEARLFETADIVCSSAPKNLHNEEGFRSIRQELNRVAGQLKDQGFRISYHNHAFEFNTAIEGRSALEYLLDTSEDNRVLAEIDVYWVKKGGYDPLAFIQPYAGRMPIIHLKDISDDEEQETSPIGTGAIDFAPILQWGEASGVEWYVVEQDRCKTDPMDCVQLSYRNLSQIIASIR